MRVEVIRFSPFSKGKLRGFADISLDGKIVLKGFRLLEGSRGLFLAPPSKESKNKEKGFDNIIYFTKNGDDLRKQMTDAVVTAYEEAPASEDDSSTKKTNRSKIDL